jgi:hypothetical protein
VDSYSLVTTHQKETNEFQYSDEFLAGHTEPLYTAEAIAAARVQALEEAAKVCLDLELDDRYKTMISTDDWNAGTLDCDTAIRALIGKEST